MKAQLTRRTLLTTGVGSLLATHPLPALTQASPLRLAFIPQENPDKLLGDIEAISGWLDLTNSGIERLTDVSHALRTQARLEPLPTRGVDVNSVVREAMVIAGGKIKMHVIDSPS